MIVLGNVIGLTPPPSAQAAVQFLCAPSGGAVALLLRAAGLAFSQRYLASSINSLKSGSVAEGAVWRSRLSKTGRLGSGGGGGGGSSRGGGG